MNRIFIVGIVFGFVLFGCVSAQFSYNWYYPEFLSYEGKLLGKKASEDLDGNVCQKDSRGYHTCVVMLKPEFQALYLDYLDMQNRLSACEHE